MSSGSYFPPPVRAVVPALRSTSGQLARTGSACVAAQHRVPVPEYEQLSFLRPVPVNYQDSKAEYLANQQVDDLEQHPASQPSPRQSLVVVQLSRSIEYSSGTGRRPYLSCRFPLCRDGQQDALSGRASEPGGCRARCQ